MIGQDLPAILPQGVRTRTVAGVNGIDMHVLEAGYEKPGRPALLLLHGFPELAFSWRKVMPTLAQAGYHVVAPDQRGYGRTGGAPNSYDDDLGPFGILNLVRDMVALLARLEVTAVDAVIGHDVGASIAAACALVRPDLFRAVAIMSAPFTGVQRWPLPGKPADDPIHEALAAIDPPRKHYHAYFATRSADADMRTCGQGLLAFLRAYFHMKSADWAQNRPTELAAWSAEELARMPDYYIMPLAADMPAAVAPAMPSADCSCSWLNDEELAFYASEYGRTGFQGGLQWYRGRMDGALARDIALFAGRTIDCPALFLAGRSDWGAFQIPGGLARMRSSVFTDMRDIRFIDGAGHWVQQEQPEAVCGQLREFLEEASTSARPGRARPSAPARQEASDKK